MKSNSVTGPLYHRIFTDLVEDIRRGRYSEGSFLPSELELSKSYDVSRITAKRALDEIAAAGLAVRQQGRGTMIRNVRRRSVRGSLSGTIEDVRRGESKYAIEVIDVRRMRASKSLARQMELSIGDEVLEAKRLLSGEAGPASYVTTHVPTSIAAGWTKRILAMKSITTLLEEAGVVMARSHENISAVPASREAATVLGVKPGEPVLRIERTVYDDKGQCVEQVTALHRSDRYDYNVNLAVAGN